MYLGDVVDYQLNNGKRLVNLTMRFNATCLVSQNGFFASLRMTDCDLLAVGANRPLP